MKFLVSTSDYWLNVAEAAQRSSCSKQTVRTHIHAGKFSVLKRYGQWLINTQSLQNYLQTKDQLKETERPIAVGWEY